ncbi:glycine zipper 2TM domain-containing protein [Oryzicola mucosus]|uniref:17 kDa surface antigen n=1 Tax=Oryzicola mucosus TaxID=2767425 RepID=A0A8J6PT09_9HYPH|nr:glycine zipper 2TM domain-containing protein [Oryzicola mucosus]
MNKLLSTFAVLSVTAMVLTGCNTPGERAVGGGVIGAGAGALAGQAIGGNTRSTVAGALIGGAAGSLIGAASAPGRCRYQEVDSRGRPVYDNYGRPVTFEDRCQ